jgi:hypothetical protein
MAKNIAISAIIRHNIGKFCNELAENRATTTQNSRKRKQQLIYSIWVLYENLPY